LERPVKTGKLDALGMAKGCIMAGIIFIIFSITYLMSIILGTIIACIIGIIIIQIIRSIIRHSHPNKPS
jgi:tetrahydromethanopterin S-methyltransferase subunit C